MEGSEASQTLAPAERRAEVFDALAILVALLLLLVVHSGGIAWARLLLTLGFTFFVPGRAIVSNWPRMSRWSPEAMSMVFSLGIITFLATVMLWARVWHPIPLFEVEAALSLVGLVIGIIRRRSHGGGVAQRLANRPGNRRLRKIARGIPALDGYSRENRARP